MTEPTAVRLARGVVAALLRAGITEVVLAPGSRNAPLAFAVWDAARAGRLRLHTRIDERTAGFLALGLTRVGARAAVVCTSGTAVANLHPAVLEAAHSGVPLVVVSADRPASLRGTGASQTTDQVRMFGDAAAFVDLAAEAELAALDALLAPAAGSPGPLQLNVQLSGTLVPVEPWPDSQIPVAAVPDGPRIAGSRAADVYRARLAEGSAHVLPAGPRTVVVAGDDAGPPARILAEAAGWPLLAEPSSGARTGPNALRCYRLLLDTELGAQVERVVVVGHPTLSRPITRLVERADVEVVAVRHAGRWAARPFPVAAEHDAVAAPVSPLLPMRPGWPPGRRPTGPRPAASTRSWRRRASRRRTTSPEPSPAPCPPAGFSSWGPPARSVTSTSWAACRRPGSGGSCSPTAGSPASTAPCPPPSVRRWAARTRPGRWRSSAT
ncbi:thiamine pyrophosphate-binding protein [Nocardioides zeae]